MDTFKLTTLSEDQQAAQAETLLSFTETIVVANPHVALKRLAHTKFTNAVMIHVDDLRVIEDFNPRIMDAALVDHINHLAEDMLVEGYLEQHPMTGIMRANKNGKPKVDITDGGCRLAALKIANERGAEISYVPVVLKDKDTSMEDLTIALARSNSGKRFTPLEMAIVVKRLKSYQMEVKTIAQRLSISVEYVNQLLTIAGAPEVIRKMISDGSVPAAVAFETLRDHGESAVSVLEGAMAKASGAGKPFTKRFLPEVILKKAISKAAPSMVQLIEDVKAQAAFNTLPSEMQKKIDDILKMVQDAREGKRPLKPKKNKQQKTKPKQDQGILPLD